MQNHSTTDIVDLKSWDFIWHLFMQSRNVRRWLFYRNEPDGQDLAIGLSSKPILTGYHFSSCPASSISFSFPPSSSNFISESCDHYFPDIGDLHTVVSNVDGVVLGISYGFKGVYPIIPLIHFVTGNPQFRDARYIVRRTASTRLVVKTISCFARIEFCWLISGILLVATCFEAVDGGPVVDDIHIRIIMPRQVSDLIAAYEAIDDFDALQSLSRVGGVSGDEHSKQILNIPEWAVSFEVKEPQRFGNHDITKMVFDESVYEQANRVGQESMVLQENSNVLTHRNEKASDIQLRSIDEEYHMINNITVVHPNDRRQSVNVEPRIDSPVNTKMDAVEMIRYMWDAKLKRRTYPINQNNVHVSENDGSDNRHGYIRDKQESNHQGVNSSSDNHVAVSTMRLWTHFQVMSRKARQNGVFHSKLSVRESNSVLQENESNYMFLCTSHGISIDSRIKRLINQLGLNFSEPQTDRLLFSLQNQRTKLHEGRLIEHHYVGVSASEHHSSILIKPLQSVPLSTANSTSQNNRSSFTDDYDNGSNIFSSLGKSSQRSPSHPNKRTVSSSNESYTDEVIDIQTSNILTTIPVSKSTAMKLHKRPRFTASSTVPQTTQPTIQSDTDPLRNPKQGDLEGAACVDAFHVASMGRRLCDEQGHESWECVQCGAIIKGKRGNLKRHVLIKHFHARPFVCDANGCGRRFQNRVNLTRHVLNVHQGRPFTCPRCPRTFKLEAQLKTHIERAHVDALSNSTGRGEARCDRCGRCFDLLSTLNRHRRTVHGISDQTSMISPLGPQSHLNKDDIELQKENNEEKVDENT